MEVASAAAEETNNNMTMEESKKEHLVDPINKSSHIDAIIKWTVLNLPASITPISPWQTRVDQAAHSCKIKEDNQPVQSEAGSQGLRTLASRSAGSTEISILDAKWRQTPTPTSTHHVAPYILDKSGGSQLRVDANT